MYEHVLSEHLLTKYILGLDRASRQKSTRPARITREDRWSGGESV
jgi:hypothetical protein